MSNTSAPDQEVQILERVESYEDSASGFGFAGSLVVYRVKDILYHATMKGPCCPPLTVNPADFENIQQIRFSAYSPKFSVEFTPAKDLPNGFHVKKPSLVNYHRIKEGPQPNLIADSVLDEVRICELLSLHPHPNIATYLGCQVTDGMITGICLEEYPHTLQQEVNPGHLNKRMLRDSYQATKDYSSVLTGIENGIRHLHSLGLVHNDINPMNIMIDGERAVIIDFGSCRKLGERLENVGRTYEWYDFNVETSLPENDLNALEEIRIWLGVSSNPFQFRD